MSFNNKSGGDDVHSNSKSKKPNEILTFDHQASKICSNLFKRIENTCTGEKDLKESKEKVVKRRRKVEEEGSKISISYKEVDDHCQQLTNEKKLLVDQLQDRLRPIQGTNFKQKKDLNIIRANFKRKSRFKSNIIDLLQNIGFKYGYSTETETDVFSLAFNNLDPDEPSKSYYIYFSQFEKKSIFQALTIEPKFPESEELINYCNENKDLTQLIYTALNNWRLNPK